MKINEFVTETLNGIIKGIKDSQDYAKENGARLNPVVGNWDSGKVMTTYFKGEEYARLVSAVKFDIAVTAANEQESGGNAGIKVFAVSIGGKLTDKDTQQTVSRISFEVNVALPNVLP